MTEPYAFLQVLIEKRFHTEDFRSILISCIRDEFYGDHTSTFEDIKMYFYSRGANVRMVEALNDDYLEWEFLMFAIDSGNKQQVDKLLEKRYPDYAVKLKERSIHEYAHL